MGRVSSRWSHAGNSWFGRMGLFVCGHDVELETNSYKVFTSTDVDGHAPCIKCDVVVQWLQVENWTVSLLNTCSLQFYNFKHGPIFSCE